MVLLFTYSPMTHLPRPWVQIVLNIVSVLKSNLVVSINMLEIFIDIATYICFVSLCIRARKNLNINNNIGIYFLLLLNIFHNNISCFLIL
jgi:hypothetical protein